MSGPAICLTFGRFGETGRTTDGRPVLLAGPLGRATGLPLLLDHDWDLQIGAVQCATEYRSAGRPAEYGACAQITRPDLVPPGLLDGLRLGTVGVSLGAATGGAALVVIDPATAVAEVSLLTAGPPGLPGACAWLDDSREPAARADRAFRQLVAVGQRVTI